MKRIRACCHVTCDLFHHGHVRFFQQAKAFCDELIVGLSSDEDVGAYKAPPILSMDERVEVVRACRFVDQVIPNAPPYVSEEWMRAHDIDLVVASEDYTEADLESYYRHPRANGKLKLIPYTPAISTSEIIRRCQARSETRSTGSALKSLPQEPFAERFSKRQVLISEEMYGRGHQATGGVALCNILLPKLGLKKGDRVIDLGCGTGGVAFHLAKHWPVSVLGVDLTASNIELCAARAKHDPDLPVEFACQDISELEVTEPYEVMWIRDALMYVAEKLACLQAIHRCIVPHRRSVVADFCRGDGRLSREFDDHVYACGYHLPTISEYQEILDRAGFQVLEVENYTELSVEWMRAEMERFRQNKQQFLTRYTQEEHDHLLRRWDMKIDFCRKQQLQTAYFIVSR